MWIHTLLVYLDDLLKSDFVFWGVVIIVCVFAWLGCDWIAEWEEGRRAKRGEVIRRERLAAYLRASRGEDRRPVRDRVAADVRDRRTAYAPNRPMWLAEPPDRAQSAGQRLGAQGRMKGDAA